MESDHNPHEKLYGDKLNTVDEVLGLCREKGQEENWSSLFLNEYFFEQANSMHYDYNKKKTPIWHHKDFCLLKIH